MVIPVVLVSWLLEVCRCLRWIEDNGTPLFYKPDDGPMEAETCRLVDSYRIIDNCTTLLCNEGITKSFIISNNYQILPCVLIVVT